jgi:hypothetical protein
MLAGIFVFGVDSHDLASQTICQAPFVETLDIDFTPVGRTKFDFRFLGNTGGNNFTQRTSTLTLLNDRANGRVAGFVTKPTAAMGIH